MRPGSHQVTLITGDRVNLTDAGGGHFSVTVVAGRRPDGHQPTFQGHAGPDGDFIVPDDAQPAIQAGRLDRKLFDVKYLAENGYAEDGSSQLPVIVQYPASRSARTVQAAADALPASTPTRALASIHGAAVKVSKPQAGRFWAAVRGAPVAPGKAAPTTLSGGIARVWLDQKVKVDLNESVPLIGAPQAWAAGYDGTGVKAAILDTGIDQSHPDLQGKVVASQSLVPGVDTVNDGNGHGTHVASILAGTGAAEDGKYRGVAPGAQLVIGKVLNDSGVGFDSWIIAGMQWAAHSGARVVSMSLGGGPTDGTDPLSQAVDDLTAETGTLFVIAAGNSGPGEATITAPGAADAALTVAATDKSDQLAGFSSRGPRTGDDALKPDIAAPGVGIVAARAKGTPVGDRDPVDDFYTRLSGTSMATPHVAGAAAILAQEFPDWTAPQLKAALMSTARDDGYTVYQQGAGRVDVARAFSQKVYATTPNVDFGRISSGQNGDPISKPVGYTNLTDQPVTLTLTPTLRTGTGDPAPDGAFTVDTATLTVPAGGIATATVTIDPANLPKKEYTGAVIATADGVRLSTPVGLSNLATLTIHIVHDRPFGGFLDLLPVELENQAATATASAVATTRPLSAVRSTAAVDQPGTSVFEATITTSVQPGTYSLTSFLFWGADDNEVSYATVPDPQISVTGDTEVTLDARQAREITFTTPRPSQRVWSTLSVERTGADGILYSSFFLPAGEIGNGNHILAAPTERVTKGTFRYATQATLANPQLTMTVDQPEHRRLNVITRAYGDQGMAFANDWFGWAPFTKDQTVPLVDAGLGDPQDIEGLDLHGKLALLRYGELHDFGPQCRPLIDRVENVRQAGAVGVVWFPMNGCQVPTWPADSTDPQTEMSLPEAWLRPAEGQHLADLAAKGTVLVHVNADPNVRYTYELKEYEEQQIPSSLDYTYTSRDLAQFDTAFHYSPKPGTGVSGWHAFKPGATFSFGVGTLFAVPQTRPVYVGPLSSNTIWYEMSATSESWDQGAQRWDQGPYRQIDQPIRTDNQRSTVPIAPGAISLDAIHDAQPDTPIIWEICSLCREGNTFWPIYPLTAGNGVNAFVSFLSETQHVYRADGEEIPETPQGPFGVPGFTLPEQPGTYRFVDDAALVNGSRIGTTWTFTSPGTASQTATQPGYVCLGRLWGSNDACQPQPTIFLNYDLGDSLGLDNTVAAPGQSTIHIRAYHAQSTQQMPPIAGLKLWASTDDGAHWERVPVRQLMHGTDSVFSATVVYPKYADTTGAVSLRAEAWDAADNRVEQTITRAYGLSDRGTDRPS